MRRIFGILRVEEEAQFVTVVFVLRETLLKFFVFRWIRTCGADFGEIIESSGRPRHLSTIPLKNFHLFKITKLVINFYLKKKILTNNFKQVEVF